MPARELATPTRFVSVRKPELGELELLSEDGSEGDVWPCELCGTLGVIHVRGGGHGYAAWDGERPCTSEEGGCDGHGYVHGFDDNGHGMPARPLDLVGVR